MNRFFAALSVFALTAGGCTAYAPQTTPHPSSRPRVSDIGAFLFSETRDAFTDEPAPMLSTFDEKENGMLSWECLREGLSVRAGMSGPVSKAQGRVVVRSRFDEREPSVGSDWLVDRQGQFTFAYMNPADNIAFTTATLNSSRVRLEVTDPVTGIRQTYTFSLEGFQEGYGRLPCRHAS